MKRVISTLFVLIMVFSLFSVPINATEEVQIVKDIEKIEMFEYYYKNKDTFEILESALKGYNDKYGYETERKIRMGSGAEEFTAAEFDEEKIVIYCSFIEESEINEKDRYKYVRTFYNGIKDFIEDYAMHDFYTDLHTFNEYCASILISVVMETTVISPTKPYHPYEEILEIISLILGYISLFYLVYLFIYIISCKIKKKRIKNIKRKVILLVLSFLYILFGGLFGIISWILSMAAYF